MISRRFVLGAPLGFLWAHVARASGSAPIGIVYDDSGGLFIDVAINGTSSRLILDTGASQGALDIAFCERQRLELRRAGTVEGTAGHIEAQETDVTLAVPGLAPFKATFSVYGLGSYDPTCVGILGADALSRAPFQLDYAARTLTWNAAQPSASTALKLDNRIPRLRARINGADIDLRVDTGATLQPGKTFFVNLTEAQAKSAGLTGSPRQVFTATGTGGTVLKLPVFDLAQFSIAGVTLAPARAIVQPPVGYFARADAVGFCGNSVLDKLKPYFDYAHGVFAFEPPAL